MENKKTILKDVVINGYRQSDGKKTFVKFSQCKEDGLYVKFKENIVSITPEIMNNSEKRYVNSIIVGREIVSMVEHIFSAINGLGIDNLIVEFDSDEAPFFADSKFISEELNNNILYLDLVKDFFKIDKELEIFGKDGQYCKMIPADDFVVDMTIDFDNIIGKQKYLYSFKNNDYIKDISFARSMLIFEIKEGENPWVDFKKHFEVFPKTFPKDPKKSAFIAYNKKGYITPLRDPLEPVKHKLLDFIGDLIFIGKIPKVKFEVYKPGHSFNRKIVKYLIENKL